MKNFTRSCRIPALVLLLPAASGFSMTFLQDNSRIIGALSGTIGVAYQTTAPFGPSTNSGRFFDPGSQTFFNGGSYSGSAVGMGFDGGYRILQSAPVGSDGQGFIVHMTANASASVAPEGIPFWNITSGLYASARTDTALDLVLRGARPGGYYIFSTTTGAGQTVVSLGGVELRSGAARNPVLADGQGDLRVKAVLSAQAATGGGTISSTRQSDLAFQVGTPATVHYFGVGVDWSLTDPDSACVFGDWDAKNLKTSLQSKIPLDGVAIRLDASLSGQQNAQILSAAFDSFKSTVHENDTVIFYVSSHGAGDADLFSKIWIAADGANGLTVGSIAGLIGQLPASSRKLIIIDACHAGEIAESLPKYDHNVQVLSATTIEATTPSDDSDWTGVFTKKLVAEWNAGQTDLTSIAAKMDGYAGGLAGHLLPLRDSGSAIFTGLRPQLNEGTEFSGDLLGPFSTTNAQRPLLIGPRVAAGHMSFSVTNFSPGSAISIQTSADLISWRQSDFRQLFATNLSYSFVVTNGSRAFYRAKAVY